MLALCASISSPDRGAAALFCLFLLNKREPSKLARSISGSPSPSPRPRPRPRPSFIALLLLLGVAEADVVELGERVAGDVLDAVVVDVAVAEVADALVEVDEAVLVEEGAPDVEIAEAFVT